RAALACAWSHAPAGSSPSTSSPRSRHTGAAGTRRDEAVRRSALLRAAALGGQRSTRLDVDEILDVLRTVVADMGFAEPQVFELCGADGPELTARPVRQSRDALGIPPGDPRLLAAAAARAEGKPIAWPPRDATEPPSPRRPHRAAEPPSLHREARGPPRPRPTG